MRNVIDLADERRKRAPTGPTAGVDVTIDRGLVSLDLNLPPTTLAIVAAGDTLQVCWTPEAARVVARRLLKAADEAERDPDEAERDPKP